MTNLQHQMLEEDDLQDVSDVDENAKPETVRTVIDPMTATAQELDDLIKEGEEAMDQTLKEFADSTKKGPQKKVNQAQVGKVNQKSLVDDKTRREKLKTMILKLKEDI